MRLQDYAARRFALAGAVVRERYPYCKPLDKLPIRGPNGAEHLVSFARYDYLGLADDPRVIAAAHAAIDEVGVGSYGSRLVGGERSIHRSLESEISSFLRVEDSLVLVSGYGTNVSLLSHVLAREDLLLVDEAAHNSVMVGTQLSRAEVLTFRHNDLEHLRALLAARRKERNRVLIVVEGLYSMDGDIPDLPRLLELCRRYDAWLMIDEAHSIGVLGATGRGITEHFGVPIEEVDLVVGTLSKAFASCGGFISARRDVIEWLRFTLPGFVYSVGMPPASAGAALAALGVLRAEPQRLVRLAEMSRYFLAGARERGLDVGNAAGAAVIPVMFEGAPVAMAAANAALAAGYFVPPIVQIAVPKNAPRLRFFITATHTRRDIDGVLDVLAPFAVGDVVEPQPVGRDQGEADRTTGSAVVSGPDGPRPPQDVRRAHS